MAAPPAVVQAVVERWPDAGYSILDKMNNALIIMVRNPVKGKVKTRLAKDIGDDKAYAIYLKLLGHANEIAMDIDVDRFLFYDHDVERHDQFDNALYKKYVQCSGDLGVRMDYAFSIPFKNEYKNVVMIGSDCFDIRAHHIQTAFEKLADHDFVLGPATDGGYYLIGMKKWNRTVFQNKQWSTAHLFNETKNEILNNNGRLFELEPLSDIDTIDDLNNTPELTYS